MHEFLVIKPPKIKDPLNKKIHNYSPTVFVIIQARMGSTRFPGKSMELVNGNTLMENIKMQLEGSRLIEKVILATTDKKQDDDLAKHSENIGWQVFRGSEKDVLNRYSEAAKYCSCKEEDIVIRLTGDDILPDPMLIDKLLGVFIQNASKLSFAATNFLPRLPYGCDIELMTGASLYKADSDASTEFCREHVTPYIRQNPELFDLFSFEFRENFSDFSTSIDEPFHRLKAERLHRYLEQNYTRPFSIREVIDALKME